MPEPRALSPSSVAGFVLAGGHSSRMGTDKALALFRDVPLVQVALGIFAGAQIAAAIAGSRSALGEFAAEIPDTFAESGPLGGIHAALAQSRSEWNVFLPVDLPMIPASLLKCLLQRAILTDAPVTAVRLNGRLEPFPVILRRSALPVIERLLIKNEAACHAAWHAIPAQLASTLDSPAVEQLVQSGCCWHPAALPPALWFQSANTPADLAFLNRISSSLET